MAFPRVRIMTWDGIGIYLITGVSMVVASSMLLGPAVYMQAKGELLCEKGRGAPVRVHMLGDAAPLSGDARLLGTSSAFLYLRWPVQLSADAVPTTSVR